MSSMNEPLVRTTQLVKRYGERSAVDRVDLTVRPGEVYGFLGPNGAGKTTTLRILLGLIRPTSGSATVLGAAPGDPAALSRLGMLVESPAFYPYLSGRENLRVLARYARVPDSRVGECLDAVDLTGRAKERFATYSLGMKQRLGVAAALLKDPDLLILDEPTNGLDPAGMSDMRALIRRLGSGGRTVLLSSHLLGDVQQICDRVGVISRGRLLAEGAVADLIGEPALFAVVDPLPQARVVAERVLGAARVGERDGGLWLAARAGEVADLNRELVLGGVAVRELSWARRSLEDIFFELTEGSEQCVAA
jgi:ABC-type multidrug transport system ATPase subunit